MTLAHRTRKIIRSAAAAPAGDILASDPKNVAIGEKEKEYDGNLERKEKRKKPITARIKRPLKLPSRNEDEEYADEELELSPRRRRR